MLINGITLTNFRCFTKQQFAFTSKVVLIEGPNGCGKSTLLEALHYACYLKSFRTANGREIVAHSGDHFFISVDFEERNFAAQHHVQIGFAHNSKVVKLDQKCV